MPHPWREVVGGASETQVGAGEGGMALEKLPKQSALPCTAFILNNCTMCLELAAPKANSRKINKEKQVSFRSEERLDVPMDTA